MPVSENDTPDQSETLASFPAVESSPGSESSESSKNGSENSYDPEGFFTPAVIRRNMKMVILLEAILMTGSQDLGIALMPLLNYLTDSYTVIGFVQALAFASFVGSFLSPFITRRFPYKKWYYLTTVTLWALAPMVLGVILIASPLFAPSLMTLLVLTVVCYSIFQIITGFTVLPHNEFLASCIPPTHRGRMFGISTAIYALLSVGATYVSYLILDRMDKPGSYGYIFVMTCIIWLIGFAFASFAREKRTPVEKSPKPWSLTMLKAFWQDKPYIHYLGFFTLTQMTFIPVFGLLSNYGLKELGMADKMVAVMVGIGMTVLILTSAPSGWLIDKFTPKRVIPICMLLIGGGFLFFFFYFKTMGLFIGFTVVRVALAAYFPACTILAVSIPKPHHRAGHFAIQAIFFGAFLGIGPFFIGVISDLINPRLVILLTALVAFAFYPISKYMLRVLGDSWKTYS